MPVLTKDRLNCWNCGHTIDKSVALDNLYTRINCDQCNLPLYVSISKTNKIHLKRTCRKLFDKDIAYKESTKYLMDISKKYVEEEFGECTKELLEMFFVRGKNLRVNSARKNMYLEAKMVDIRNVDIIRFFEENGGVITKPTLYTYLK